MAALLVGLPVDVPGGTVNRLCGSGLDAVGQAARAIRCGEADLLVAGGVDDPGPVRDAEVRDAVGARHRGARHHHRVALREPRDGARLRHRPDAADRGAPRDRAGISREDQDAFALRSQERIARAADEERLAREIAPVAVPQGRGTPSSWSATSTPDESPVQKYMRDARVMTRYEGTSQIQKLLIGRGETRISAFL